MGIISSGLLSSQLCIAQYSILYYILISLPLTSIHLHPSLPSLLLFITCLVPPVIQSSLSPLSLPTSSSHSFHSYIPLSQHCCFLIDTCHTYHLPSSQSSASPPSLPQSLFFQASLCGCCLWWWSTSWGQQVSSDCSKHGPQNGRITLELMLVLFIFVKLVICKSAVCCCMCVCKTCHQGVQMYV